MKTFSDKQAFGKSIVSGVVLTLLAGLQLNKRGEVNDEKGAKNETHSRD